MSSLWDQWLDDSVDVSDPRQLQDDISARREAVWHQACQMGRCRYANAAIDTDHPAPVDSTTTCGGYHGTKYLELTTGATTWRWRKCVRHQDWWRRRQAYLRESKPQRKGGRGYDDDGE